MASGATRLRRDAYRLLEEGRHGQVLLITAATRGTCWPGAGLTMRADLPSARWDAALRHCGPPTAGASAGRAGPLRLSGLQLMRSYDLQHRAPLPAVVVDRDGGQQAQ